VADAHWCALPKRFRDLAVTISMLLLEGNVSELLGAVARYRPDLLQNAHVAPNCWRINGNGSEGPFLNQSRGRVR
jgi:hypothetical protein